MGRLLAILPVFSAQNRSMRYNQHIPVVTTTDARVFRFPGVHISANMR